MHPDHAIEVQVFSLVASRGVIYAWRFPSYWVYLVDND